MRTLLLLITASMAACGGKLESVYPVSNDAPSGCESPQVTIDPVLAPYLNEVWGEDTPLTSDIWQGDLREGTQPYLGSCHHGSLQIVINLDFINELGIDPRFTLLHELMHCEQGLRGHVDSVFFSDGCRYYVMSTRLHPSASSTACWERHKSHYINQKKSDVLAGYTGIDEQ